jgi:hypothetical protein
MNDHLASQSVVPQPAHCAKAHNMACVAVNCLGRYHLANAFVENRSFASKIVALGSGGATRTPDRSNFRSLSQAALTLGQSQLMEGTMLCPRITQQSLRKPLDAGCFEGDSTRAGPKPPVQLYDRDHLQSHLEKFPQETL